MTEPDWLTQRFAEPRGLLMALACRMLGSRGDAEDAMQEAWLRVSRADGGKGANPAGGGTTVGARAPGTAGGHTSVRPAGQAGPEDEALLADAVGAALMVVLDTLAPAERLPPVPPTASGVWFAERARLLE